ncbi:MAG: AAA family ATPase [Bacteroidales bacterium]|nr:AAA family ATPase [Bacteroidales bacterium]
MKLTRTQLNDIYANRTDVSKLFNSGNFSAPKRGICWQATASLTDVKRVMWNVLCHAIFRESNGEKQPVVMKEQFSAIAEWLHHNDGKGLLLYGSCGQGKTLLAKYVIPACLEIIHHKIAHYYDAAELQDNRDEMKMALWYGITVIDDVGAEATSMFKEQAFSRLIDNADKNGKIVIATTNYSEKELQERYGARVVDRIKGNMVRVMFDGKESLRTK